MKICTTFLLLILLSSTSFAQTPGYLGKKLAVYGSIAASPALNKSYLEEDYDGLSSASNVGINSRFDLSADYTLSKSIAMGISIKHSTTKIPFAYYSTDIDSYLSEFDEASYFGDINLNANFKSIYFKIFPFRKKGVIAPVGQYNKIEFIFGKMQGSTGGWSSDVYEDDQYAYYADREPLVLPEFADLNYQLDDNILGFLYSFGNTWVISDKVILDFGAQFGWVFANSTLPEIGNKGNTGYYEWDYHQDAIDRLEGSFLMNFNLGAGYFIF